jgi:hypothetical protein
MTVYTYSQLEGLWIGAGGRRSLAPVMAAIAMAESGGRSNALNPDDNNGTQSSFGLWQISNGTHTPPSRNWANAQENARLAVAKYKEQGLKAWGTYNSGAYKKFLRGHVPPTGGGGGNSGSGGGTGLPFVGPIAGWLADPVNALERLGLIVLGGILVLVGLAILSAAPARAAARELGALSPKKQSNGPLLSPEDKEEKERRFQLAQKNAAIGERTVSVKESRENRIGRVSRIHGGRTGGREPNPEPIHGG